MAKVVAISATSTSPAKPREILSHWCSKNNLEPLFKFSGSKKKQNIKCELIVPGYNYIGIGNSKTEKSAEKSATKDFILFLVRQNALPPIPKKIKNIGDSGIGGSSIKTKELKSLDMKSIVHGQITNSAKKKKEKNYNAMHNVLDVNINEKLTNNIYSLLDDLQIKPTVTKGTGIMYKNKTLILNQISIPFEKLDEFSGIRVIPWNPPQSNWDPWLADWISNPESLTEISNKMEKKLIEKQHSFIFQRRIKDRTKLPIFNKRQAILDIIRANSVVIIKGSTGCGKTTQVCQFILDDYIKQNKGAYCNIVCTQPRKIPAISIAKRVAYERAENLGKSIGYTVRFDNINPQTFGGILFCTVEILILKLKSGLFGISHVIVDEIHERGAENELLLIILKEMVQKYSDLKVVLMSANANLKLFSKYFNNCPIIDVEGHCYAVKEYFLEDIVQMLNYVPTIQKKIPKKQIYEESVNCNLFVSDAYSDEIRLRVSMIDEDSHHLDIIQALLTYIENDLNMVGAVLIFLPGWTWISKLKTYLENNEFIDEKYSILLLHSSLSHAEQNKVFMPVPHGKRKVILSTNIAETSITIKDVVFVIDYGKAKIVKFSNNINEFNTIWASKVNVEQRKGRAGRVQPGICFNLYTKERFNRLDDNISSGLMNCPLSKIGLTIKLLNLGDINTFLKKAIDPPYTEDVNEAISMLKEMKCLEANGYLTALGRILAQLPVEPQFGRMMVLGNIFKLGDSLCTIAAGSSIEYNLFKKSYDENTTMHDFSGNRCSDQLAFLNAFMHFKSSKHCNGVHSMDYFGKYNLSKFMLKTTCNIKNQIIKKFKKFGFPEHCFETKYFDFGNTGIFDEPQLDMVTALLTMAFYPNVYRYEAKRKVHLKTKDFSIISRDSVNCPRVGSRDIDFQLPFFVFQNQVNIMCVNSTMVSPIHLLLFGSHKVEYTKSLVVLDDWIYLNMDVEIAAAIVALRPAIDDLIVKTAQNPKLISKPNKVDIKLINVLKDLCKFNAGRNTLSSITFNNGSRKKQLELKAEIQREKEDEIERQLEQKIRIATASSRKNAYKHKKDSKLFGSARGYKDRREGGLGCSREYEGPSSERWFLFINGESDDRRGAEERAKLVQKLNNRCKHMDYFERAKRIKEIPLLQRAWKEKQVHDQKCWKPQEAERIQLAIQERKLAEQTRERLARMKPVMDIFLAEMKERRAAEYQEKLAVFEEQLIAIRKDRLKKIIKERKSALIKKRKKEKRRKEVVERLRKQKEEKLRKQEEEQLRKQEEENKKKEERLRKKEEERLRKKEEQKLRKQEEVKKRKEEKKNEKERLANLSRKKQLELKAEIQREKEDENEKRRKELVERLRKQKEEKLRKQEEEQLRKQEEENKKEEERLRKKEEERLRKKEEQKLRKQEEVKKRKEEKKNEKERLANLTRQERQAEFRRKKEEIKRAILDRKLKNLARDNDSGVGSGSSSGGAFDKTIKDGPRVVPSGRHTFFRENSQET